MRTGLQPIGRILDWIRVFVFCYLGRKQGGQRMKLMARAVLLSLLVSLIAAHFRFSRASRHTGVPRPQRVAPGDTPLNLVETPDGFLISTNSGYGAQYLQAYDEVHNKVADRIDFPSLWYGLAYAPSQKSILASTGATSVLVIPLHAGEFGEPREIVLDHCELTAGLAVQDDSTAVVACNRTYEVVRFNF